MTGWVSLLVTIFVVLVAVKQLQGAWSYASMASTSAASDSLPVYLGAKAMHEGLDPTKVEHLQRVYASGDVGVTKALFSVLYPPSMHLMLQPLGGLSHGGVLYYWRRVLLLLLVVGLGFAGTAGVAVRRWPAAAALAVGACVALFPFFLASQLALGQANLGVAGCFALAVGFAARGRLGLVAAVAAVGSAAKLVPAMIFWPLLCGRAGRALAIGAAVGLALLGLTMIHVPLDRIVDNVMDTLAFQRSVEPHWLHAPGVPDWGRFVGFLKRPPLTLLSLALVAWTQWVHRHHEDRQSMSLALGIALLGAALGADGSGAAAPYATLAMPATAVLVTGPLAKEASRVSWLALPFAGAVYLFLPGGIDAPIHDVELRLVAACTVIWLGVALRLVAGAQPWRLVPAVTAVMLVLSALSYTAVYTWFPPYGGPKTLPQASPGSMTTPSMPPATRRGTP